MTLTDSYRAALAVAVPIISIDTPDPAATMRALMAATKPKDAETPQRPYLRWSSATGIEGLNGMGQTLAGELNTPEGENTPQDPRAITANPAEALAVLLKVPERAVTFILGAHTIINDPVVSQSIWELRDEYASRGAMLVLLSPGMTLPPELSNDVVSLDEPLPDAAQLKTLATDLLNHAELNPKEHQADLEKSVSAMCGLAAFPAEQALAMSLNPKGIDLDALWDRKRRMIADTPSLSVYAGPETFADIGGNDNIKTFLQGVLEGERAPQAIVFVDEIEKQLGGIGGGESSGTSQDQLGQLLTEMQDTEAVGILALGPPGAGKSAVAKAAGNEAGILTVELDLGAAKSSLVGSSERRVRQALKVIRAVSNSRPLYIATCNSIALLPPELRRRFSLGTFFFDLPSDEERAAIWSIYLKKYKLGGKRGPTLPPDTGWTGAEIRNCCDIADRLGVTLEEASSFVVPVATSAAAVIENLRKQANHCYISAAHPGLYEYATITPAKTTGRKINLRAKDTTFMTPGGQR